MVRIAGALVLAALLSCQALAADAPRVEMFGGYQYFRANTGLDVTNVDHFNLNGWNASLSGFFNRYVGITADFGGVYGSPEVLGIPIHTKEHTFMFGPVVRLPNPTHLTPFVHALGGGVRFSADASGVNGAETDAAWAVGGGVDLYGSDLCDPSGAGGLSADKVRRDESEQLPIFRWNRDQVLRKNTGKFGQNSQAHCVRGLALMQSCL